MICVQSLQNDTSQHELSKFTLFPSCKGNKWAQIGKMTEASLLSERMYRGKEGWEVILLENCLS